MSVSNMLMQDTVDKLVLPVLGRLIYVPMDSGVFPNSGLAFTLNKGYFEMENLDILLYLLDYCKDSDLGIKLVGSTNKVHLSSGRIVYRQRVYFDDISKVIGVCKAFALQVHISSKLQVTLDNVTKCLKDIPCLEAYANKFNESVDTYLLWGFKIQLDKLLTGEGVTSTWSSEISQHLKNKKGYLDRMPYLVRHYDADSNPELFKIVDTSDIRLFTTKDWGYTTRHKASDIRKKVLKV